MGNEFDLIREKRRGFYLINTDEGVLFNLPYKEQNIMLCDLLTALLKNKSFDDFCYSIVVV